MQEVGYRTVLSIPPPAWINLERLPPAYAAMKNEYDKYTELRDELTQEAEVFMIYPQLWSFRRILGKRYIIEGNPTVFLEKREAALLASQPGATVILVDIADLNKREQRISQIIVAMSQLEVCVSFMRQTRYNTGSIIVTKPNEDTDVAELQQAVAETLKQLVYK